MRSTTALTVLLSRSSRKTLHSLMLSIVGEKTSMIYLGCFVMTVALTHMMAHTAVAATMFPLLMAINALYSDDDRPTKFGKGLFIGMAYVAGAGSIAPIDRSVAATRISKRDALPRIDISG